jgi:hypothetical protein
MGFVKPKSYDMPPQGLMRILSIGCVPMPFGIPMQDLSRRLDRVILPIDERQVGDGVLDFTIAHIS